MNKYASLSIHVYHEMMVQCNKFDNMSQTGEVTHHVRWLSI